MSLDQRRAGILLHPTSLPGRFAIGDLGDEAYRFLDWMQQAGLTYWQILPLGPTGYGDSPYQCFSAFAGNPLLISPDRLQNEGLLTIEEVNSLGENWGQTDYGFAYESKHRILKLAFDRYRQNQPEPIKQRYQQWCRDPEVQNWLPDFALFKAIKNAQGGKGWIDWPVDLRKRDSAALARAKEDLKEDFQFQEFIQFLFFDQWNALRSAAHEKGIEIVGDAPIYVSYDSADTWANQQDFHLDAEGRPVAVAGVPPDYFSATGQLWGNPLYNWEAMEKNGYAWWVARLRAIFTQVDIVRLDHFRGFMGYYAVPYGHQTAENGEWKRGPGAKFFEAMRKAIGDLPIIAEDLGEITQDVDDVRRQFNLPGMVILQFAWTAASEDPTIVDPNNQFLPHRHEQNSVVYSGTHDNDTTLGWWNHTSADIERRTMQVYLSVDGNVPHEDLIRCGMRSVGNTFIAPAQDFLGLDSDARMNLPGRGEGNWFWRLSPGQLSDDLANHIRNLNLLYERCANPPQQAIPAPPKQPPY